MMGFNLAALLAVVFAFGLGYWAAAMMNATVVRQGGGVRVSPPQVAPPASVCHTSDQLAYCIYERSLCLDQRTGTLLVLTQNATLHGKAAPVHNTLQPSPWHLPFAVPLQMPDGLRGSIFDHSSPLPYRSFFPAATYVMGAPADAVWMAGRSLVAAFDDQGPNIYHFVNKMQVAWLARLREFDMLGRVGYDQAFLFRGPYSPWQAGFAALALGPTTKTTFMRTNALASQQPPTTICFERAIVPGAALYLADGLATSVLFHEMAGVRVSSPAERNVITIFARTDKRVITNVDEVELVCGEMAAARGLVVERVHWTAETPFEVQTKQMARTAIYLTTHGSVLNHCIWMEPGAGVVIELNPFQFLYPLDQQIVMNRGLYYLRHEATKAESFPASSLEDGISARDCFARMDCYIARRDANLHMDLDALRVLLAQAISLVAPVAPTLGGANSK